jgi:hypothetical protein
MYSISAAPAAGGPGPGPGVTALSLRVRLSDPGQAGNLKPPMRAWQPGPGRPARLRLIRVMMPGSRSSTGKCLPAAAAARRRARATVTDRTLASCGPGPLAAPVGRWRRRIVRVRAGRP